MRKLFLLKTILAGSGVSTGSTVGDEFNEYDNTYSRKTFSVWGDDEE